MAHDDRYQAAARLVHLALFLAAACGVGLAGDAFGQTGTVEGTVPLEPMKRPPMGALYRTDTVAPIREPDPPRAVIYLQPADGTPPRPPGNAVVTISQHGYQFRPGIAVVPAGSQVRFPNMDDEFHSVFSYSSVNRFDLGRYRKDEESPPISFEEPGVVRVYCEIHKHMRGLLLVVDTPWFTTSDADGEFTLADVPPGRYRIHAFLPSERLIESSVTVAAGRTVRVDLGAAP